MVAVVPLTTAAEQPVLTVDAAPAGPEPAIIPPTSRAAASADAAAAAAMRRHADLQICERIVTILITR
jgi:hypothetical protein